MAVQLMAHIQQISGCEVTPTTQPPFDQGEEYEYHIYFDDQFIIEAKSRFSRDSVRLPVSEFDGDKIESEWWNEED